ncbi:MAG: hypothetical protein ACLQA5_16840 [Solirubrobacteraceae bacterium]
MLLAGSLCAVWLVFAAAATPALARGHGLRYSVTFVARWCPAYTDIYANRARNDIVESLMDLGPDTQYDESGILVNPAYEGLPPQDACQPLPGWEFALGTDYESRAVTGVWGSLSKVTGAYDTSIVTKLATPLLNQNGRPVPGAFLAGAVTVYLTRDQIEQAGEPDRLWAQGGIPTDPVLANKFFITAPGDPEYAFGTLRCATDNLNGDNVEFIFFPQGVNHVFCYAYYVKPPPTSGTITIKKDVVGAPAGTNPAFPFNGNLSFDPSGFQLTDGQSLDFYRAGGGDWTVTEGAVDNYRLTSLGCLSATGASTATYSGATATVHLVALDHVTCTYTNTYTPPPGGLTISKITRGGVGTFSYSVTPMSGGTVQHAKATTTTPGVPVSAVPSLGALAPGTYQVQERPPSNSGGTWTLRSVNCNGVGRSANGPVTVTIASGAQVTCLFTNAFTPRGSISLAKLTVGGTGSASFQVEPTFGEPATYLQTATTTSEGVAADAVPDTPADATDTLDLGTYRITEQPPLATDAGDWTLVQVECNGELMPFAQGSTEVTLTRAQPAVRCVFSDSLSATPAPEPGPEPPKPLPPEPPVPPLPDPDQPSSPWSDISVTKTASPPVVMLGGVVTYDITVKNHGADDAADVVLGDAPSAGAAVVSVQTEIGKCKTTLPVTCYLGTLKPGQSVHVTVRLRPTRQSRGFTNRAVVGTDTYDPNLTNNVAHATVAVVAPPPPVGFG